MPLFRPAQRSEKFRSRLAETKRDVIACQQLRYLTFIEERGLGVGASDQGCLDADAFDTDCLHVMVEDGASGQLVCCFRMLPLTGAQISQSYAAQYYELTKLGAYPGEMIEMGRFCIHPAWRDPAILRTAWAAASKVVDARGVGLVFGCSSFHGVDAEAYRDAFALLKEQHLAPRRWLPRVKAPDVFRFARKLKLARPNRKLALRVMPPLLRSYLVMGGWVSDHAVIDRDLNTLHVFTGVEMARMPEGRAKLMRRA